MRWLVLALACVAVGCGGKAEPAPGPQTPLPSVSGQGTPAPQSPIVAPIPGVPGAPVNDPGAVAADGLQYDGSIAFERSLP